MNFILLYILITTVCGRNSRNVEFNELPQEKLLDAVCRSFHKSNESESSCFFDKCKLDNRTTEFGDLHILNGNNESLLTVPQLACREDNMASFFWQTKNDFAYFLEAKSVENQNEIFSRATTCNFSTLNNLIKGIKYGIRLWAVSFFNKQILYSDVIDITLPKNRTFLLPVTHVFLQNMTCTQNSCDAIIEWRPNEDYSCQFDLIWLKEGSIIEDRINVISGLHQASLKDLRFATNYSVSIMALSEDSYESPKKTFYFQTPSCLEIFKTLDKCPPKPPKNFLINETIIEESRKYNVNLRWQKPHLLPNYYIAHFTNLIGNNTSGERLNISGNATQAVFEKVTLGDFYHVSLMACSPGGCSEKVASERHRTDLVIDVSSHHQWRVLTFVLAPLVTVLVGALIFNYYRTKLKRKEERDKYFTELDEEKLPESVEKIEINLIKSEVPDQWELDPTKLSVQSIVGMGAFGVVRGALLEMKDKTIPVAVKMLKESPSVEEIRQFTQEINIMKSVKQHPYIVSLVGCVTVGRLDGPLLVVEYCSRGNLQEYLRNAWEHFCNLQQEMNNDESFSNQRNYFANRTYDIHYLNEDEFIIQPKHLLSIARQVALGMEHLARTRVVHRDLAARNVLVCEDHTVKVSDFGLSRDVYRDNVYCKSGAGKLPICWMALESLTHQVYTTYSDVWSFGILLWEIVTLGGTPYVGVRTSDLLEFLKNGNRLGRPSNCSPQLYAIMQSCWKASPKHRPTFTELCKKLEDLLENISQYLQLETVDSSLNCSTKITSNKLHQNLKSNERYIKPVNAFR